MTEYLSDLKNEIGFYFTILKLIFYFSIGAIFLVLLNQIVKFFSFIFSSFSREKFLNRLNFIFKLFIFILFSTIIGWLFVNTVF